MSHRWQKAQKAELQGWVAGHCPLDQLTRRSWKENLGQAGVSLQRLEQMDGPVLEVGCGPRGVIHCLTSQGGKRFGCDPLAWEYHQADLTVTNTGVEHVAATGESLPFSDSMFQLVLCINVLDHADAPQAVLKEISRVLRPDSGLFLLDVMGIFPVWLPVRPLIDKFDRPHPHHLAPAEMRELIRKSNLEIVSERVVPRMGYRITPSCFTSKSGIGHLVSNMIHLRMTYRARRR